MVTIISECTERNIAPGLSFRLMMQVPLFILFWARGCAVTRYGASLLTSRPCPKVRMWSGGGGNRTPVLDLVDKYELQPFYMSFHMVI